MDSQFLYEALDPATRQRYDIIKTERTRAFYQEMMSRDAKIWDVCFKLVYIILAIGCIASVITFNFGYIGLAMFASFGVSAIAAVFTTDW